MKILELTAPAESLIRWVAALPLISVASDTPTTILRRGKSAPRSVAHISHPWRTSGAPSLKRLFLIVPKSDCQGYIKFITPLEQLYTGSREPFRPIESAAAVTEIRPWLRFEGGIGGWEHNFLELGLSFVD
jgi:hypothetical protein